MLVDNNVFFRNGLQDILKNMGGADIIGVASDGQEFMEMLETRNPDIVFMDIRMPRLNGYETTKLALAKTPDLTIIAYSSFEETCFIKQMLDSGARGYLSKCRNNIDIINKLLANWKVGYFFSKEIEASVDKIKNI